jgi:tRNA threonylcarbamoyladenosine biosynthesis protein TsaE
MRIKVYLCSVELLINTPSGLDAAMPRLLEALGGRRKIALYGDMGAGKTTLTAAFCRFLGVAGPTASPTFSIVNEYIYPDETGGQALIHHLDLYRLKNLAEAVDIGLEDLLDDPWYCLIEWPQIAEPLFESNVARLRLEILDEQKRMLHIDEPVNHLNAGLIS